MKILNKREQSLETLRLFEKCKEITEPGKLVFHFDNSLNKKSVWVPRRQDNRGRDEVTAIDLELLFRNNEIMKGFGEVEVTLSLLN